MQDGIEGKKLQTGSKEGISATPTTTTTNISYKRPHTQLHTSVNDDVEN